MEGFYLTPEQKIVWYFSLPLRYSIAKFIKIITMAPDNL